MTDRCRRCETSHNAASARSTEGDQLCAIYLDNLNYAKKSAELG